MLLSNDNKLVEKWLMHISDLINEQNIKKYINME